MGEETGTRVIDISKLGPNPFVINLKIPVNKLTMSGQYRADRDGLMLPVEIEVERDQYCKVYSDSKRRLAIVGLSSRATELLMWVFFEAVPGRDYLWINYQRYMREKNIKAYNTYKDAVRELVVHSFLQVTVMQNVYWINPHYFFSGSRANAFPENVVRK